MITILLVGGFGGDGESERWPNPTFENTIPNVASAGVGEVRNSTAILKFIIISKKLKNFTENDDGISFG